HPKPSQPPTPLGDVDCCGQGIRLPGAPKAARVIYARADADGTRIGNRETSTLFGATIDLAYGIIHGTTIANSHGGGTITAAGTYVGSTLLNVPDSVFADPRSKHLSL